MSLINRIKRKLYHTFLDPQKHLKIKIHCNSQWYGNQYGGFYVNPDILGKKSVIYSFGVGEDISFDREILNKHDCRVWAFDPTPKSIKWVKENVTDQRFNFFEFGLSKKSGETTFFLPKNKDHVSGSIHQQDFVDKGNSIRVQMKSFEDILRMTGHTHIDLLKMDIEGAEYDVIPSILNSGVTIEQIQIEFHDRFFEDGVQKTKLAIKQLNKKGFRLFAISESHEELSFIHQSLLR